METQILDLQSDLVQNRESYKSESTNVQKEKEMLQWGLSTRIKDLETETLSLVNENKILKQQNLRLNEEIIKFDQKIAEIQQENLQNIESK